MTLRAKLRACWCILTRHDWSEPFQTRMWQTDEGGEILELPGPWFIRCRRCGQQGRVMGPRPEHPMCKCASVPELGDPPVPPPIALPEESR